jgi:hypothetical protein
LPHRDDSGAEPSKTPLLGLFSDERSLPPDEVTPVRTDGKAK